MPTYPLRVHPSGRYLTDSKGVPFLVCGDSAWSGIAQPTLSQIRTYLDDRAARGFNATLWNLIEHQFTSHSPLWANANGDLPFDATNQFDQPTTAYFDSAVTFVNEAAARGIVVFLVPAYLGFLSTQEGWYDVMEAETTGQMRTYGQYVGTRFQNCPNVVYVMGGDRSPADVTRTEQVAAGILDIDTTKIFTAHCAPGVSPAAFWGSETWMAAGVSLNDTYTKDSGGDIPYNDGTVEYNRSPTRPYLNLENRYEGGPSFDQATPLQSRDQLWWNMLTGTCGHFFGNDPVWTFQTTWLTSLASQAVAYMTIGWKTFQKREWWKLVPDLNNGTLITAGAGTYTAADFATAARASDGSFLMAYLPSSRQVTVNAAKLSTPFDALWMDPTNEAYTVIGRGISNSGSLVTTPPGTNAGGDSDWVLLLDAKPDRGISKAWGF